MKTTNGKRGGNLVGKPHNDKSGNPVGGIKAVVTDAGGKPVELEGGEVIINKEASKKHWKELSRINQSAGNGVPISAPVDPHDEDPTDYEVGGKIIEFNRNHLPNKWILSYAKGIKKDHPEIWKLGGNIYGNTAFENLVRVSERGYWLDSEEWMYKKWQSFLARHQHDFRIAGVVAVLKWGGKVNKGWAYMKSLIQAEIKKRSGKPKSMKDGGKVNLQIKDKDGDIVTLDNYTNIDYLNRDELNYDVLRNFATLKMLAKAGFIELHEDTGQRYSNKFEKIGTKKSWYEKGVSIIQHNYIKSAKKPKFEYKGREFAIGYRKVSDYVELYVLEYDPYLNKSKDGDGRIEIAEDDKMKSGGKVITYKNKFNKKYGFDSDESHSLAEIAKLTKLKLSALQDIYDKGIGAYKTNPQSVRPNVKSKEQWAMARVYSAVMGGKAAKVDANELERGRKYKDGGNVNEDIFIDGVKSTIQDFIEIYQREIIRVHNQDINLNPSKIEYYGNDFQTIRALKDYNRKTNPYISANDGLKEHYMKKIIGKIYSEVPFRKFANAFRKHIYKYFTAERYKESLRGRGKTFQELASYIIGDGGYDIKSENDFLNFAKEFNVEIPKKENYKFRDGGSVGFENKLFDELAQHDAPSFKDGGLVDSYKRAMTNLEINGIVVYDDESETVVIAYNDGLHKRKLGIYNLNLIYKTIAIIDEDAASRIIVNINQGIFDEFDKNKVTDYNKYKTLVIINQFEVIYNSTQHDALSFKDGGEVKDNFENTKKLIEELKKHSFYQRGIVSVSKDGQKYRYDHYKLKYANSSNWLVKLFEKAAEENTGKPYYTQFHHTDHFSFNYDRPKYKGVPNGRMSMSELILM